MNSPLTRLVARWRNTRLQSQLLILSTLSLTSLMLLLAFYVSTQQSSELSRRMTENGRILAMDILHTADYMLQNNDSAALEHFLIKTAENNRGFRGIQVLDQTGNSLAHITISPDNRVTPVHSMPHPQIPSVMQKDRSLQTSWQNNVLVVRTHQAEPHKAAWVRLEYDPAQRASLQKDIWQSNLMTAGIVVLLNLLLFALLLRLPTRAIRQVAKFAARLSRNHGEEFAMKGGSRELNSLITSLNKTVHTLSRQTQMIVSGDNHLKNVTEELSATRQALEQRADEHSQELSWQASHDPLTHLANRSEFENRINELLPGAHGEEHEHTICFLDLDQFKVINDTCGHIAGDELLKQVAGLLENTIRKSDTLARLGGDEFGILLPDCSVAMAEMVAMNILETMQGFRFAYESKTFKISTSIGIAPVTRDCIDSAQLMSNADLACYSSKEKGGNRIYIYNESDWQLSQRRNEMNWVAMINKALDEGSFVLHRQVIRPVDSNGGLTHYEMLVRMLGQENELIYPDTFVPAATRYKLMPLIDRLVINKTFEYCHAIISEGRPLDAIYTINLSGDTMCDPCILNFIRDKLVSYRLPGTRFCFEITETAVIADLNGALHFIRELKKLGCRFALDDFGTGLSSFSYLKTLPIDYLKIDGSFVRDINTDPMDRAIVESIHRLAHVVGLKTIAEFVENASILTILKEIGVDYVQGYSIGRPEPLPAPGQFDRALA